MDAKHKKLLLLYLGAGVATLLWEVDRVAANPPKPIWGGLGASTATDAQGAALSNASGPRSAIVGAIETVALWPLAVLHNLQADRGTSSSSATVEEPAGSSDVSVDVGLPTIDQVQV